MSKVIPLNPPSRNQSQLIDDAVREQASLWLAKLDAGASEDDIQTVGVWLAEDSNHERVFMEMAQLWDQMSILDELSSVFPLNEYRSREQPKSFQFNRRMAFSLASVVVGAIAVGSVLIGGYYGETNTFHGAYETAVGEQLTLELEDGSTVKLNTGTAIEVDFSKSFRKIKLSDGEGLFQVAKDSSRPFQVFVGNQMVEAVGTAFSVHRPGVDEVEVMVSEGEVVLYRQQKGSQADSIELVNGVASDQSQSGKVSLLAGQYIVSSERNEDVVPIDLAPDQVETRLSWQHGMLLFRDDPLDKVLSQVERYTTVNIEAAAEVRDVRVGGYFRVNDIEGLLAAIENNFQIDIQHIDDKNIYLAPRQSGVQQ